MVLSEQLLDAQEARRRLFLRGIAALHAVLTSLASLQMGLLGQLPSAALAGSAATGFALLWWWALRASVSRVATMLIALMLVHGLLVERLTGGSVAINMFTGMVPVIAAATLEVTGVIAASVLAFAKCALSIAMGREQAASLDTPSRFAPFVILVIGTAIGLLSSLTERRSMRQQAARERATMDAEASAHAAEERLNWVAGEVNDLVALLASDTLYTFASASHERILGIAPRELVGTSALRLIAGEDHEAAARAFREALAGETREVVAHLATRTGPRRTFHVRVRGVSLAGRPQVALVARDITELRALATELETARRMDALGRLAGGVAHDFNNLLTVIGACASILRSTLPTEDTGQRDLTTIDDAIKQAAGLTNQLLSFARRQVLPGGEAASARTILRLEPLLQRALGASVRLEARAEGSAWEAGLSAAALEQIVMNLAVNARDAMDGSGRLTLTAYDRTLRSGEVSDLDPGDYLLIEVADSGPGVDPAIAPRIFDPFFTTKPAGKGTGLGLSTSFGITRQVGGTLRLASSPGEGSVFRVYLPRAQPSAPTEPREATVSVAARQTRLSILAIDDEERICELVARMLEAAGHRAVTASSAAEACEEARRHLFDVFLIDVMLGSEDGLETLSRLRELQPRARYVAMSGHTPSPQRLAELRETGVGYLVKPFAEAALLRAVDPRAGAPEMAPRAGGTSP
jgi:PAS domain S-box-containing protein